jgi:hypothetical protein
VPYATCIRCKGSTLPLTLKQRLHSLNGIHPHCAADIGHFVTVHVLLRIAELNFETGFYLDNLLSDVALRLHSATFCLCPAAPRMFWAHKIGHRYKGSNHMTCTQIYKISLTKAGQAARWRRRTC